MRNSNCVAIAPTATISNIIGVAASIEPEYQNIYVKSNLSGEFTVVNEQLVRDLKAIGQWDEVMVADLKYFDGSLAKIDRVPAEMRELYATAFEVETKWIVEAGARRQKWIDQAQSLNIYMAGASGKKLDETYKLAWVRGLKTTYYLRTLAATSAEKSTGRGGELNAVSAHGSGAYRRKQHRAWTKNPRRRHASLTIRRARPVSNGGSKDSVAHARDSTRRQRSPRGVRGRGTALRPRQEREAIRAGSKGTAVPKGRRHAVCVGSQHVIPGGALKYANAPSFPGWRFATRTCSSLAHSTKGRTHCLATSHRPGTSSKHATSGTTKSGWNSTMDAKVWSILRTSCTVKIARSSAIATSSRRFISTMDSRRSRGSTASTSRLSSCTSV
jgi:hypothetical protein